ncbi:MAG: VCBS repeat-containing protein [Flavobacteriales bacterium]|nr:VCBS repeat-containing protein [Flavobacteriales bacterium]
MRSPFLFKFHFLTGIVLSVAAQAQFGPSHQFFCESPRSVDLADFDGNGTMDLMIASREGLGFYSNTNGQGDFAEPLFLGVLETVACVGDVNNDGLLDVMASREQNSGMFWFQNAGNGSFVDPVSILADVSAEEMHAADLDADGDPDLFFTKADGTLQVCMNNDGVFSAAMQLASLTQLAHAKAVDVDADGDLDITFSSLVANEVSVCTNENGWFLPQEQISVAGHGTVLDMDNDGHPDLLVANTMASQVAWQRSNVDEVGFQGPDVLDPAFDSPAYVTASDLDGDGDLDVIATSGTVSEVAWFENTNGLGDFGPHQTVCYGIQVNAIATGDVDHDGDEDLFVASGDLNKVIWYTNVTNATGGIMGRVFNDINGDGVFNGNDHGLMNMRVECTDIGATYTNASGMYWFSAVPAGYTVSKPAELNWDFTTTDEYTVNVPTQGASQNNDFGLQADAVISELQPDLGSAPMRCGTAISYWASVLNTGNQVSDVELRVDLDDLSTYVGADPSPISVVNGIATWVFPNVQPTHQRLVHLVVHLPGSEHVGETLHDVLTATASIAGVPISVDTRIYSPILLCAVDPNDKQVSPAGEGEEHLTPVGSTFFYEVRFQNTGNAMAHDVVILDQLDADLDHSTLAVLNASHTCQTLLRPDGLLSFTFEGINLPDSGSDFIGSQGFVRFAIRHMADAQVGTELTNSVGIYFDNNAPVITNTTFNKLGDRTVTGVDEMLSSSNELMVLPNPAQGSATVRLGESFQGRIDLQLFNASGAMIRQLTRRSSTVLLEQGELPKGVYLLRAADEIGTERTTRLVFE